ncbi:Uncharacterised protein [Peptoniphilus harei]|uniref:Uncharacterized protein n=1 Tax=Peptoniphilus harei TaxID=54005 RepID=A0A2X1YYJ1_9FIRM|nr:Uncharacterised protein [Peptoniphilus harei]
MYDKIKFLTAGDSAIVMEFGDTIEKEINARIAAVVESFILSYIFYSYTYVKLSLINQIVFQRLLL